MVKIFLAIQTTGFDPRLHGIHRISGLVEVSGAPVDIIEISMQPHPKAQIDEAVIRKSGTTPERLKTLQSMQDGYREFITAISKHIDRYDNKQKTWIVGFNNRTYTDVFLRTWFELNGDSFFGSYFYPDSLDTLVLASQHLLNQRSAMPSFKLGRVAKTLGIEVDETRLEADSSYAVWIIHKVYKIVAAHPAPIKEETFDDLL